MPIAQRMLGNVVVIEVMGAITSGEGGGVDLKKIHTLLQQGHRKLLLDLRKVSYIDSAGLDQLAQIIDKRQHVCCLRRLHVAVASKASRQPGVVNVVRDHGFHSRIGVLTSSQAAGALAQPKRRRSGMRPGGE
jgi:anti-anti-sigma regulatory factor